MLHSGFYEKIKVKSKPNNLKQDVKNKSFATHRLELLKAIVSKNTYWCTRMRVKHAHLVYNANSFVNKLFTIVIEKRRGIHHVNRATMALILMYTIRESQKKKKNYRLMEWLNYFDLKIFVYIKKRELEWLILCLNFYRGLFADKGGKIHTYFWTDL